MELEKTKLQKVVEKIAYQQTAEDQADDLFNKMGILNEYVQELLGINVDSKRSFMWYSTEDLIDCLPENQPLYKDSGLWQIRTDDMINVFMCQNVNETLRGFILRFLDWLEEHNLADNVWVDLSCKKKT